MEKDKSMKQETTETAEATCCEVAETTQAERTICCETTKTECGEMIEVAEATCYKTEETAGSREEHSQEVCCRHKHRQDAEIKGLLNRLNRIEGQVRGVRTMVEEERYCVDILTQVMAIQAALNSFNKVLLSNHIKTCVVQDIQTGKEASVEELCRTIQKLMK